MDIEIDESYEQKYREGGVRYDKPSTFFSPNRVFLMPCIQVIVKISGRFLSDFHSLDLFLLHFVDTLHDVFDLYLVLGEGLGVNWLGRKGLKKANSQMEERNLGPSFLVVR